MSSGSEFHADTGTTLCEKEYFLYLCDCVSSESYVNDLWLYMMQEQEIYLYQ